MIRFKVISLWLFVALICTATLSRVVNNYAASEVEKASKTYHGIEGRLKMHRELVVALFHVQRGQRGYFLTGNTPYLDPYYVGLNTVPMLFSELKKGAVIYGTLPIFDQIEPLLNSYISGMVATVNLYQNGDVTAAMQMVRTDEEKRLMDSIQDLLAQAEAKKLLLQKQSEKSLEATLIFQQRSESLGFLMIFLIGVALLWQVKSKLLTSVNALRSHLASLGGELAEMRNPLPEADLDGVRRELNSLIRRVLSKEQEVLQSREREIQTAREAAQRQEEFGSVLAHELRTPLNTLIGTIECEKVDGKWSQDETHHRIEMVARNLIELVNSSLDYQRISLGHYEVANERFNMSEMLDELAQSFKAFSQSQGITLSVSTSFKASLDFVGDPIKIKQVLMNLVSNALKFTPSNGWVSVNASLIGLELSIEVADSGVGIPEDKLDVIFEPFQQADSGIKRKYGGTGIGLTLCKKIAECLNGRLQVRSVVGHGSEFTFRVPIGIFRSAKPELVIKQLSSSAGQSLSLEGYRLLMVEDHVLNAKINKKLLESHFGCSVLHVETGEKALEIIAKGERFNLILMDVNLGAGLSGLETTEILIQRYRACPPVLALTAGVTESQKQAVFVSGMVGVLEKPFAIEQASALLREHCFGKKNTQNADVLLGKASDFEVLV